MDCTVMWKLVYSGMLCIWQSQSTQELYISVKVLDTCIRLRSFWKEVSNDKTRNILNSLTLLTLIVSESMKYVIQFTFFDQLYWGPKNFHRYSIVKNPNKVANPNEEDKEYHHVLIALNFFLGRLHFYAGYRLEAKWLKYI